MITDLPLGLQVVLGDLLKKSDANYEVLKDAIKTDKRFSGVVYEHILSNPENINESKVLLAIVNQYRESIKLLHQNPEYIKNYITDLIAYLNQLILKDEESRKPKTREPGDE